MFIAANWKMNLDKQSILEFSNFLQNFKFSQDVNACIFPPMTYIDYLNNLVQKEFIKISRFSSIYYMVTLNR